jgi:asparaginyl-tRNA synthetase
VEYFDDTVFLTQTGQLHVEAACMALRKVYCLGPTFRAEKSKTRRHLTEFWMLEPEIAFADLDAVIALAEDLVRETVQAVVARHEEDLRTLGRDIQPLRSVRKPFERITYSEAAELLRSDEIRAWLGEALEADRQRLQSRIEELRETEDRLASVTNAAKQDRLQRQAASLREEIHDLERDVAAQPGHMELARTFEWGKDLGGSDETILSRWFDRPVFVTDYPKEAKAFYMKASTDDPRVVRNMDLLAPEGYGEIMGGSQREDDLDTLAARMREQGLAPEDYSWYLDLRRYGSVPHGGFGLGIERTLAWICGLKHVREAIPFPRTMGRVWP